MTQYSQLILCICGGMSIFLAWRYISTGDYISGMVESAFAVAFLLLSLVDRRK